MKESVTKFDLEAAFKALDEIEAPKATKGLKANRPALTEIFSTKSKFDVLFEEYYDVSSTEELSDAKDDREADIAKAKLARIEKIVDLDADSPDDLLPSYVGKYIIQCPQCMTLFYKNPEDVEESEEDATIVNVNEVCQHCGNESGYTLIGKVGAADEPIAEETPVEGESGEDLNLDELDFGEEEIPEEGASEESFEEIPEGEDFDLDSELAALDLDAEEEEDEKKEEAFYSEHDASPLLEQLTESSEADISADEFSKLIQSPEFKKPISHAETRALLKSLGESGKETEEETDNEKLAESVFINGEELKYAVINADGTFAGSPCTSEDEARELAMQDEGRVIVKLDEADLEALTEGGLGLLSKTIGKKLGQVGKSIKNKVSGAIDKFADDTMTREEKADWVLTYALEEYVKEISIDKKGKLIPDEEGRKFHTFLVVGFKDYYSNGKSITVAPSFSNNSLVIGMPEAQERGSYKEADDLAKGWSTRQGCGPAFIYMAKDKKDTKAVFLCEYFKGELAYDQLEKYFQVVKKDLEGKERIEKGGGVQETESSELKTEEIQVSELKQGDVIILGKQNAEVIEIANSKFGANNKAIKIKTEDGTTEVINVESTAKVSKIIATEAKESFKSPSNNLTTIMENLDNIQDNKLEKIISNSLIETYQNVAGFKLTDCKYLNEKLTLDGKIVFVSGNTRDTAYTFTEALSKEDNNITLIGLNEKLGTDKQFTLTGYTDNGSKTFIAESLKRTNKA